MARVRLAGPRVMLDDVLGLAQDLGVLHVAQTEIPGIDAQPSDEARHLRRIVDDVEKSLSLLGVVGSKTGKPARQQPPPSLPRAAHHARRLRREIEAVAQAITELEDERVLLLRYREFFSAFEPLLGHELAWPDGHAFYVVLRAGAGGAVETLRASLEAAVGKELELLARSLDSGETAVLLLASTAAAPKVGQLLNEARVQELPAPKSLGETNLLRALPVLKARLAALPSELKARRASLAQLREAHERELEALRAWLRDRLLVLEVRTQAYVGRHLFVVEGWLPRDKVDELIAHFASATSPAVLVEVVGEEVWRGEDAPVALANPALFKPFEIITCMLPLPKYGTIDPTPYVAVFFPMFFGLMLGDVGYGAVLALLALGLRLKSKPATSMRSVAAVAGACAAFSMVFGVLFGELFGTLGHLVGLAPIVFNREQAVLPFLALAIGLGVVHVLLGLVLAVVRAWHTGHRREAMGRGVAAVMVALTVASLLAAFQVLPKVLFTPFVIAVLVAFPVLIALEGLVAVVELLSTFGHILSYARIMALGTASLMLAVVANQLVGAMGSVLVGVLFALLFHVVNFVIGVFSPTIHALRLHYVEFFGKFFSPGGTAYRPLAHWHAVNQGS